MSRLGSITRMSRDSRSGWRSHAKSTADWGKGRSGAWSEPPAPATRPPFLRTQHHWFRACAGTLNHLTLHSNSLLFALLITLLITQPIALRIKHSGSQPKSYSSRQLIIHSTGQRNSGHNWHRTCHHISQQSWHHISGLTG